MNRVEEPPRLAPAPRRNAAPPASPAAASSTAGAALLILAWFVATAWMRPLAMPDEGRYVGIAWEMMHSGHWLTPTLDGLPYFHKPPLFYWITAASMSVFGVSDLAARAAPIAGAWLGTFGLYLYTRRWCGERLARYAAVALAVMPLTYLGGQYANMDMLVAGFIGASVLLLADAATRVELGLPHRAGLVAAYGMAALGVLSKGLIGAALPLFVIVAWLIATRRPRLLWRLVSMPGLAVFLLITLPWFIVLESRFAGFLDYFFIVQQVKRFAETGFNNVRPFWFYPALLVAASLPWLPWFGPLRPRDWLSDPERGRVRWLMLLWTGVVTVFFSIPQSKLPGYILPAVPPLAFLVADTLLSGGTAAVSPGRRRRWWLSAGISALIGIAVVVVVTLRPPGSTRDVAVALSRERGPGERVYMLQEYYFDLPVYARLDLPVTVVDDWDHPAEIAAHDNWRKEIADAGQFAPAEAAASLVTPSALAARVCEGAAATSWFVGSADAPSRYGFLTRAEVVARTRQATTLWKVDRRRPEMADALGCRR